MTPLQPAAATCYGAPARANSRAGIAVLNQWRTSAHRPMHGAFLMATHQAWATVHDQRRAVRGEHLLRLSTGRYCNRVPSATPIAVGLADFTKPVESKNAK